MALASNGETEPPLRSEAPGAKNKGFLHAFLPATNAKVKALYDVSDHFGGRGRLVLPSFRPPHIRPEHVMVAATEVMLEFAETVQGWCTYGTLAPSSRPG